MNKDVIIGLDAGTSVIKAVAFNMEGRTLASASRPNTYNSVANGGIEQDMARTWNDAAAVLAELSGTLENIASRTLAVAVTGQGDGCWLIDADGRPVHDGWLWLDARAKVESREIEASGSIATIYEKTGTGVNVCQMRTQLRWMQKHDPQLLGRAATALHCKDWLYFMLTGIRATDPTEGVFTFGDFRDRDYSEAVIDALGLRDLRHLLPPIIDGASRCEGLTKLASEATGLPEGLPICLGYVDVMCSAIGAGLHDVDSMPGLTIIGSTGMHMRFAPNSDAVVLNQDRSGYTMAFPGQAFAQIQTNMAATLNIDWMLDLARDVLASQGVKRERDALLEGLDERMMAARSGVACYHPYISSAGERGPFAEPDARASFTGLDQTLNWFDLMRAVYDGLALAARDCYEAMGPTPREIRLTGGAARSKALRKILSGALNAPVRTVAQPESGAAGAAMIAAVQQGVFTDIAAATRAWVTPLLEVPEPPDAGLVQHYDNLFKGYASVRAAMPQAWAALALTRSSSQ